MAIMWAIQQELAERRAKNASIKRKLEGNNEEGEGEQPRPSKTQVTSQPQRTETLHNLCSRVYLYSVGTKYISNLLNRYLWMFWY